MPNVVTIDMSTPSVQYLCKKDKRLAKVISMVGSISYVPHEEDAYAFLVHEIFEQMLSVKAGQKIYSRLEELCGEEISSVRIAALIDEQIRSTGTSNANSYPFPSSHVSFASAISTISYRSFTNGRKQKDSTYPLKS